VNENITVPGQFYHAVQYTAAVARIDDRSGITLKSVSETLEEGLEVDRLSDHRSPGFAFDNVAGSYLTDARARSSARQLTAARQIYRLAGFMLGARA
jgi:hypothetical protein